MFSYSPLWKQLIDRNITKTEFRKELKFGTNTLATMNKNGYVSMELLDKICLHLNCKIEDIIEFRKE